MTQRRFPPPWRIERLPGGFKVVDAHGQSLAYFYARENDTTPARLACSQWMKREGWRATSRSCRNYWAPLGQTGKGAGDKPGRGGLAFWNLIKFNQFLNCGPFNLPWGPYTGEASTPRKDVRGFSFA